MSVFVLHTRLGITVLSANGTSFSTRDRDNDGDSDMNCAEESKGGWWFNGCSGGNTTEEYNLNAEYVDNGTNSGIKRIGCTEGGCQYTTRSFWEIRRK